MINAIFKYEGRETIIQCNMNEKMRDIIKKYKNKVEIENEYYLYSGNTINEELKLEEIINELDKSNNIIKIVVCSDIISENNNIIESKEMICPDCKENVIIDIRDYKIQMKCKNNHNNIILIIKLK